MDILLEAVRRHIARHVECVECEIVSGAGLRVWAIGYRGVRYRYSDHLGLGYCSSY